MLEKPMSVAVLGSGGREHALARKLAQSRWCRSVVVLPGNDGMAVEFAEANRRGTLAARAGVQPAEFSDLPALAQALKAQGVEFVVVGPDDLLAAGAIDELERVGLPAFGPKKAAAKLEWSKAFAKETMESAGVPTARHALIGAGDVAKLPGVARELGGYPIVLKFDGLALGKGVRICADETDAKEFLAEVFEQQKFSRAKPSPEEAAGPNGPAVIIEEFLTGHEVSVFAVTDGQTYALLDPACDHKRLGDGNTGPNTGGMGAYSPVPWLTRSQLVEMGERIFPPVLARMREQGTPFKGLLYAGLMVQGAKYWVLEFNARFGDPETQALMPRLESDLMPLLYGAATGELERHVDLYPIRWSKNACVNLVCASKGYPEKPETGFEIHGLGGTNPDFAGEQIYFAGVKAMGDRLVTAGGRVLSVSCCGDSLEDARRNALAAAEKINFDGKHYRRDVGRVRTF